METFVGDTIEITLKTGIDISGYDTYMMKFRRPDGTHGYWNAIIHPTNVKWMVYTTDTNDINMEGIWAIQAHVESLLGAELHGKWVEFTVYTPFPDLTTPPPTTAAPTTAAP